jgi:hypothetical protein
MTKKELEKKVADLVGRVAELASALLALSLKQQSNYVFVPAPAVQPLTIGPALPNTPKWPPYTPYIGDIPGSYPTVTCGTATSKKSGYEDLKVWN